MVETALVMPFLVALLVGVIEFALLLFTFSSMQTAARDVGRQLAVNFVGPAAAPAAIRDLIPGWSQKELAVAVAQTAPGDPASNTYVVTVSMPARAATPVAFFTNLFADWTLVTTVEMKQEMPA